jgi:hypothetical protein
VASYAEDGAAPAIEKRYGLGADGALEVTYTLRSTRPRQGTLEVEINLGLHVPNADDRWVEIDGRRADPSHFAARARHDGVTRAAFVDAWATAASSWRSTARPRSRARRSRPSRSPRAAPSACSRDSSSPPASR